MKRSVKIFLTVAVIILALLILACAGWFVYTRFCIDRYVITSDWETVTFRDETYVPLEKTYASDKELQADLDYMNDHIGKNIGIAVFPKRTLADLVWPVWVMEYDGDTSHHQIFIRGLMDVGRIYIRQ